jgi:hypothetical protein
MGEPNIDIVIDCHDIEALLEFWASALGYRRVAVGTTTACCCQRPRGRRTRS